MLPSGTRPSGLATPCSLFLPPQTVIRKRSRTRRLRVQPSTDRRARSRDPLLPRSTSGAARRPHRIANRVRKVADHPLGRGVGVRRQLQRAATAFSACRRILSAARSRPTSGQSAIFAHRCGAGICPPGLSLDCCGPRFAASRRAANRRPRPSTAAPFRRHARPASAQKRLHPTSTGRLRRPPTPTPPA